jgi:hypothetical protein
MTTTNTICLLLLCIIYLTQASDLPPLQDNSPRIQSAFNCTNPTIDCSGRGQCLNGTKCLCDDNYITYPSDSRPQCNYKQETRLVPFLLSMIFGEFTGCGAFMLGENAWGVSQLVVFWVPIIFAVCLSYCLLDMNDIIIGCLGCLWVSAIIGMYIAVLVLIGTAEFTDQEGAPLGNWI